MKKKNIKSTSYLSIQERLSHSAMIANFFKVYKKSLSYIPIIAITCTMIAFLLYFLPIDSRPLSLSLLTFPFSLPLFFQQKKVSTFIFAGFIDGVLKTGLFLLGIKPFSIALPFLVVYGCVSLIACACLFLFRKKTTSKIKKVKQN